MEDYPQTEEYVSKKDYEKVIQENISIKQECGFLKNQINEIYIYCNNIIKLLKK